MRIKKLRKEVLAHRITVGDKKLLMFVAVTVPGFEKNVRLNGGEIPRILLGAHAWVPWETEGMLLLKCLVST